jgi:hypothetical protein
VFGYEDASLFVSAPKEAPTFQYISLAFFQEDVKSDFTRKRLATLSLLEVRGKCQEGS